jgi:ABC-type transport system involved in multi-copper enzyme maturation permease subunit
MKDWSLWSRQIDAIVRLELRRYVGARRWIGMYLLALAPILIFVARFVALRTLVSTIGQPLLQLSEIYAGFYQLFVLRFGVFFCCAVMFSQLIRGEVLEKTMHFYLLSPVRRQLIVIGKFIAGVVAASVAFSICTIATFILLYLPNGGFGSFFLSGNGVPHLARYLIVTLIACVGYGGIFLLSGLLFKNPGVPTAILLGWESFSFALPEGLQNFSLVHHVQFLLPVSIDRGIFAVLTEPTSPLVSIPLITILTLCVLAISGWLLSRTEVTYSVD